MRRAPFEHPRYQPGQELGRGAQGVVVRVVDREAPARALCAKLWQGGAFREQALLGEYALLARARIPGLVRAHDLARCARTGAPFLVEDFIDGPDAAAWVAAALTTSRAARVLRLLGDLAATLSLLHESGFVHGDLKPANVRVGAERPILLDLGAAVGRARERSAPAAFTPAFAAPELRAGGASSPASDLYGLGALAWAVAAGGPPPEGNATAHLRERAPWLPPSVAELVRALLAEHPRDRPQSARDVLARAGLAHQAAGLPAGLPPAPVGRERELDALLAPSGGVVRYLVGPSGSGRSHLARELVTRALLAGQRARLHRFPEGAGPSLLRLTAFLRGSDLALPAHEGGLVVLDDIHLAPPELAAAVDAYRCRGEARGLTVVATAPLAPDGAEAIALAPLDDASSAALCRALAIDDPARIAEAQRASFGNPGWLVAAAGCAPLAREAALARAGALTTDARELLGAIAIAGGEIPEAIAQRLLADPAAAVAELLAAALLTRRADPSGLVYALGAPALARDLAAALGPLALVDRVAVALLADPEARVTALLALASAPSAPARRVDLLDRAASRARSEGRRSQEIDALLALAADPRERTPARLLRLERLVRDSGAAAVHAQGLDWLDEAARADPEVLSLALRRRAEKRARDGFAEDARALGEDARSAARGPAQEALALGTQGLVALYRADWVEADRALGEARARLAAIEESLHDPEEIARVDHNLGVVALYRGRIDEAIRAFERALTAKRALGDRAGMRSCLLNLGLALAKAARLDEADRVLDESIKLARSLGQTAGRGWGLAARADAAVRRGDAPAAAGWIAEATALESDLPAAVRADLAILRAQVALLDADGPRALLALQSLDPAIRESDPLIDARALTAEAAAHLAKLPVDPRRAARLAIAAIRRARAATLPEAESQALTILQTARTRRPASASAPAPDSAPVSAPDSASLWLWLSTLTTGAPPAESALSLTQLLAREQRAERVFLVAADLAGAVLTAWATDLDGLPLSDPTARLDLDLVRAALAGDGPVYRRDTPTRGGRGSQLAIASPPAATRAVVVLEHRFAPFAFDHVDATIAARWATLAGLVVRLAEAPLSEDLEPTAAPAPRPPPRGRAPSPHTTAFPVLASRRSFPDILGDSPALARALARLDAAIDTDLPALVAGETGSGKELFARALHELGRRAAHPFVAVNCGAIPDSLFEAELFGHARGSFTGADRARAGLLARAEKGTLFLDEVGELPLLRQAGLLRALESRRYRPVGSDEELPFDVRIVAATNRDLEAAVAAREFRQDLYYRLNVVEIRVPPLRERPGDVPALCRAFLERAGPGVTLAPEALAALSAHPWPGNVRELEHLMQRLAALRVPVIGLEHLPRQLRPARAAAEARPSPARPRGSAPPPTGERGEVERALLASGGNISHAAAALGLTRQGLKKRMVRIGMRAPRDVEKPS